MWPEKNGPGWRIRDRVGGRIVTVSAHIYPNKTAAKAAMVFLQADAARGEGLVPGGSQTLLSDWIAAWWPGYEPSLAASSAYSEGARIRNHILPLLGRYTLGELEHDRDLIKTWVEQLNAGEGPMGEGVKRARKKLAPKTVFNCHGLLHLILGAAVKKKLIRTNPCADPTWLPRREEREMMFLSDDEIAKLIEAMPEHWRPLVLLLVSTGLRWGEAIGLRVGRVDLRGKRPQVRVVEQLQEMPATGEMIFCPPKTAKGRRTVSFTADVAAELAPLLKGKARTDMVFLSPGGHLVRTRNFRRTWLKATKAAGVEGLRVHDLRHTHVSILISAGRSLSAISRRLGHANIAITDGVYGHLREEVDEGILLAIEESLSLVGLGAAAAEIEAELADELDEAA